MKRTTLLASLVLAASACGHKTDGAKAVAGDSSRIAITVTKDGFTPEKINVPQGQPVTLVFERKTDQTCAKEVVMEVDGKKIEKELPLNQPVELAITFAKAGELTYACGMDMIHGTIIVQ